jgi:alpha-1,6-mannosyltransferase
VAVVIIALTGLLGNSVATPPVPGHRVTPPLTLPWQLPYNGSGWPVTLLLALAALLGLAGVLLGWHALGIGWCPSPRRLAVAGAGAALLVVLVPPMGSADHLVYAAYGRIAALGGDPYTTTAEALAGHGDPVGRAVEAPWQNTPSVYGPLGTGEQWLAARIGGDSPHTIVFVLSLLGALAFVLTGLMLRELAGDDPVAKARTSIGFALNPLLLFEAVNAAHIDAFGLVFVVASWWALRRWPGWGGLVAAGVLSAAGCAVKLSFGLYVLGLLWALRHTPRRAVALLVAAAGAGVLAYAGVGLHALDQARKATSLVSLAVPLRLLVGAGVPRGAIAASGWVLLVAVLLALLPVLRRVPATDPPDLTDRRIHDAAWATALLTVAWVLTAPYSLPWYDVAAYPPLVLCLAGPVDVLLVARTCLLTLAYLPGRAVPLPRLLGEVTGHVRASVAPYLGIVLLLAVGGGGGGGRPAPPHD